jgi:Ser/Thr protein kinase RdoA (MazF antagonist)
VQDLWLAEARSLLAAYGLRPQRLLIKPLSGGQDNLNLLLEVDARRLVLRRYHVTPPDEVDWELALVEALCLRGFPTAPLCSTVDGRRRVEWGGFPAALFGFVEGDHPAEDSASAATQAAVAVAALHDVTAGLVLPYPRSPLDMARLDRLRAFAAASGERLSDPDLGAFLEAINRYRQEWSARVAGAAEALPRGVLHHDAHAGNLLVDRHGALVALLDFDEAHPGYLLLDVAALVGAWASAEDLSLNWLRAAEVVQAYSARRPLSDAECDLLPDALALYYLADAANYVRSALLVDPSRHAVADCHARQRFLRLTAGAAWRDESRVRLLARP